MFQAAVWGCALSYAYPAQRTGLWGLAVCSRGTAQFRAKYVELFRFEDNQGGVNYLYPQARSLEHRIIIGRCFWNGLNHVPVLDDLAILDAKEVDDGIPKFAWGSHPMAVQDHHVTVRK